MKIRKETCIAQTGILKLRNSKRHQPLIERPPVDSWSSEEAEPLLIIEPPVNYGTTEAKYSRRTALDIIGKRHTLAGNSHRASQPASTLAAIMGVRLSVRPSIGRSVGWPADGFAIASRSSGVSGGCMLAAVSSYISLLIQVICQIMEGRRGFKRLL